MDWQKVTPELRKKLDPSHVSQRKQGGTQVSYVEGWHVIAELNRIFGYGEWTRETLDVSCVSEREAKIGREQKDGWRVTYTARVRVTVAGVSRDGCGAGHGIGTDLGECHESALKEAETDAMKRAAMTFGNPFGLALYDKARTNVGTNPTPDDIAGVFSKAKAAMDNAADVPRLKYIWDYLNAHAAWDEGTDQQRGEASACFDRNLGRLTPDVQVKDVPENGHLYG